MNAAAQTFNDSLLGNGLTVPDAHQLAACTLAADVHLCVPRQDGFPRDALHQLKKLLKGTDFLLGKDDQHPVGTAEHQVGTESIRHGTIKPSTSDFSLHVRHLQPAQLIGYNAFQTEGSRRKQSQCIRKHNFPPLGSNYDTAFGMLCKVKRKEIDCTHCIQRLYTIHTIYFIKFVALLAHANHRVLLFQLNHSCQAVDLFKKLRSGQQAGGKLLLQVGQVVGTIRSNGQRSGNSYVQIS